MFRAPLFYAWLVELWNETRHGLRWSDERWVGLEDGMTQFARSCSIVHEHVYRLRSLKEQLRQEDRARSVLGAERIGGLQVPMTSVDESVKEEQHQFLALVGRPPARLTVERGRLGARLLVARRAKPHRISPR
jgi:hypothetical protein